MTGRIVCRFSCGAASAVATKLAIERFGDRVTIVNAYLKAEHKDNRRFLVDCAEWYGKAIEVLQDTKYNADPLEVWRRNRFIVNRSGAKCSKVLKRDVLEAHRKPTDTIVLGYTARRKTGKIAFWTPIQTRFFGALSSKLGSPKGTV